MTEVADRAVPAAPHTADVATNAAAPAVALGNARGVLRAAQAALQAGDDATLAVVLETEGSTYAATGTLALFGGTRQVGWISGGCLEPEIERRAAQAAAKSRLAWIEIDTRDDAALLSGSAIGCRGRQRLALLPLRALPGVEVLFAAWLAGGCDLLLRLDADGALAMRAGTPSRQWSLRADAPDWSAEAAHWLLRLRRPPEALILGTGPEAPSLAPLLEDLGWRVRLVEGRARWRRHAQAGAEVDDLDAEAALARTPEADAVLVMHHHFDRDLQALQALADSAVPFIGLLGPPRRRDDLLRLLTAAQRAALAPRLRAPVGIDLGGRGPEAIALSIAAQLQAWRTGASAAEPA